MQQITKQKFDWEPGVKVRGSALRNEYGEFFFFPEQTGSRGKQEKQVFEDGDIALFESKKGWFKVTIKFTKHQDLLTTIQEFLKKISASALLIRGYLEGSLKAQQKKRQTKKQKNTK